MSARSFELKNRKFGNVQVLIDHENTIRVYLHGSNVLTATNNGQVILDNCGYKTNTTKTCINTGLRLLGIDKQVRQVKGNWLLDTREFYNGMVLSK